MVCNLNGMTKELKPAGNVGAKCGDAGPALLDMRCDQLLIGKGLLHIYIWTFHHKPSYLGLSRQSFESLCLDLQTLGSRL